MSGLFTYSAYDESIKSVMTSHVLVTDSRLVLIDPIDLTANDLEEVGKLGVLESICLTTESHTRFASGLREKFNVRVFVHAAADPSVRSQADKTFRDLDLLPGDLTAIEIPGVKPSESAFFLDRDGGVMLVGDALTNLKGLDFLPDKYCANPQQSRDSLRKLLVYEFKTLCFGHGEPLRGYPKAALRNLLSQKPALAGKKSSSETSDEPCGLAAGPASAWRGSDPSYPDPRR